jgi:hypothetical protein
MHQYTVVLNCQTYKIHTNLLLSRVINESSRDWVKFDVNIKLVSELELQNTLRI